MTMNQDAKRKRQTEQDTYDYELKTAQKSSEKQSKELISDTRKGRKKKKYQFAPLDNINNARRSDGPNVLKSISVSQIRNTAISIEGRSDNKSNNTLQTPGPSESKTRGKSTNKLRRVPSINKKNNNTSLEEVIWDYRPDGKQNPDKTTSPVEMNDDIDRMDDDLRNPSSTPIIASRWKAVLNFNNMSHNDSTDQPTNTRNNTNSNVHNQPSNLKFNSQSSDNKIIPKGYLRDIDDILNDIEGDISLKPDGIRPGQKDFNELPSSPTRLEAVIKDETKKENNENAVSARTTVISTIEQRSEKKIIDFCGSSDDELFMDESIQKKLSQKPNGTIISSTKNQIRKEHTRKDKLASENVDLKSTHISSSFPGKSETNLQSGKKNVSPKVTRSKSENDKGKSLNYDEDELSDLSDDMLLSYFDNSKKEVKQIEIPKKIEVHLPKSASSIENQHKQLQKLSQWSVDRPNVARLTISSIRELNLPKIGKQKILACVDAEGKTSSVIVRHPWVYLDLNERDVIHIIEGKNFANKRLLSDDKDPNTQLPNDNLLIVHPDLLLSATTIGSSIRCMRSSIIQTLFKDNRGEPSLVMTIGNIVHELLQDCLKYKLLHEDISQNYLKNKLEELLDIYSFAIIVCNETCDSVRKEICDTHIPNIFQFVDKFVKKNNYGCYVNVSGTRRTKPISIKNIIDIEENIWSPVYGFKGFLDATVVAHCENDNFVVPLEVKTGRLRSIAHEAQGLIYTLLLHDRYEIPIDFFLLYYTRDPSMTQFPYLIHSVKHILMARNKIANFLKHRLTEIRIREILSFDLPLLEECSYCERCQDRVQSLILHKLLEDCNNDQPANTPEYEDLTKHLTANIKMYHDFFVKYNDLITKEESSVTCLNQEIFLLDSKTRESTNGLCISNLIVKQFSRDPANDELYDYTFTRSQSPDATKISMLLSQVSLNDYVFISDEVGHFVLAEGFVSKISSKEITVSTKRQLLTNKRQDVAKNAKDTSQLVQTVLVPGLDASQVVQSQNQTTYRIDKNNLQYDMSTSRFNILNLFLPPVVAGVPIEDEKTGVIKISKESDGGNEKMRKLLVDDNAPEFIPLGSPPLIVYDESQLCHFNENQKRALDLVFRCKDYSMILGMPGTGKTTVISEMIKILVANGKSILLTSYTHSAVDNILLKLVDSDINIMRLGSAKKINNRTRKFIPDLSSIKTYDEYIELINNVSVVATTCLGMNDLLFSLRSKDFDYVILDEASQISLPIALGPLQFGAKFVMVGDHYQLPPLVKNDCARQDGLEESLFKILCERHPESMVELTDQYRMCGDIIKLSNFLIYEGRLRCGSDEVRDQCLEMANGLDPIMRARVRGEATCDIGWLGKMLDPSEKVIFVDYDNIASIIEIADRDNITNLGESAIIRQILEGMARCGVSCEAIGVMSLYRAQLRLLKRELHDLERDGLEILTADQFQGRDKECIIISMVRCNHESRGGALLRELRRVNVAMTRAKSKLIIVGSRRTICSVEEIVPFMEMLEGNGWIYSLPSDALETYDFTL